MSPALFVAVVVCVLVHGGLARRCPQLAAQVDREATNGSSLELSHFSAYIDVGDIPSECVCA